MKKTTISYHFLIVFLIVISLFGYQKANATVTIQSFTSTATTITLGSSFTLNTTATTNANLGLGNVVQAVFTYSSGSGLGSSGLTSSGITINSGSPYSSGAITPIASGTYTYKVVVTDNNIVGGAATGTAFITITVVGIPPTTYSTYAYIMPLTLKTSTLGSSTDLTNFPFLVSIQDASLIIDPNSCTNKVQHPTGPQYDFAFVDGSNTEVPYDVESYNSTTGTLLVWVKLSTLYHSLNNTLSFFYGSATTIATHTTAFHQSTWTSDYKAVYHFNEGTFTGAAIDATTNAQPGTINNMTAADLVAGKIGTAYTFDGISKNISSTTIPITGTFTISAWVNLSALGFDGKIMTNQPSTATPSGGFKLGIFTNNIPETEGGGQENRQVDHPTETAAPALSVNTWYHIQGVYDGTNLYTYENGQQYQTLATTNPTATNPFYIGVGEGGNTLYFHGLIDEPRVSNVPKPADWIKAEYNNQNAPSSFITQGTITTNFTNASAIPGGIAYSTPDGSTYTYTINGAPPVTAAPPNNGTASYIITGTTTATLPVSSNISIYSLTINSGAKLDLNGGTLNIGCNIYNSSGGQILDATTAKTSLINWNGSLATQTYTGTNTPATAQIGSLTVNNSATGTVTITGGPVDVYTALTLTKGNLVVNNAGNGALTLKSTATKTAYVASITSGSVTGNVNVERYFTGGVTHANRGWRLMSSPVNNSSTLPVTTAATYNFSSLKTNLLVTGPTGGGFDPSSTGLTILFYATATELFSGPATITTPTAVGQGFYFYFRGDNTTNLANKVARVSGLYAIPEAIAGLQSGTLNQGPLNYALSNAGTGYNLVGNPYPSSIAISTSTSALTNTTPFIYTFLPGGNSIIPNSTTTPVNIASGQGFFVKSTSAASSIAFTEALKTSAQVTNAFAVIIPDPSITMQMIQDTANYNITQLRFSNLYSKNYNEMEDADVLNGFGQTVFLGAMTADGHQVAIASQPLNKQNTSVFLSVDDNSSGTYSLKRMNLTAIPGYYDVWLMDHFKNDSLDLRSNDTYAFNLDKSNAATYGNKRFEIVIRKKTLPPYQLLSFNGKHTNLANILQWNTANEYTYTAFEVQYSTNNKDFNTISSMQSTGSGSYNFTDANSATGYYRLKQTDVNGTVSYSNIVIIGAPGIFTVFPNPTADVLQFSTTETVKTTVQLKIYNSIGLLVQSSAFNTGTGRQNVSALITGIYTIQLIDNYNNKTIASTKFIKQ
jgi:hypothetical protein